MVKLFGRKTAEIEPSSVDDQGRKAVIDVRDITRTYEMGEQTLQVLKGITLGIYQGEFVSIMGPSGSGKSTLMNILGALDRPTSGEYFLDGVDVSKMSETRLAEVRNRKIGFVFQSFNLLKRTSAMRQVELPLIYAGTPSRSKRAKAALEAVGLGDRLDHLPSELSGGQQQRVAIARAIVTEPAMILADEPTGNLDSKSGTEVMQIFQRLNRELGITTVFVTHDSWIARHTGRVIMIRDGRVVADHLIAHPLTAGEQERPSDDEELSGLLEQGYGRPGQAVINQPEPVTPIIVQEPVSAVKPTPVTVEKLTPVEAKAATMVAPAVAMEPIPFDAEETAPAAVTMETPRVAVEPVPAAATVEVQPVVEPAAEILSPAIPFDDVSASVEQLTVNEAPVETPVVEPEIEPPLIPFDDLETPVVSVTAPAAEATRDEPEVTPLEALRMMKALAEATSIEPATAIEPPPVDAPVAEVMPLEPEVTAVEALLVVEPLAEVVVPEAEAPVLDVPPVVEPLAEATPPEPEVTAIEALPVVESLAEVTPVEPDVAAVAAVPASVEPDRADFVEPIAEMTETVEAPAGVVPDETPEPVAESAPETPLIDERRDGTPPSTPAVALTEQNGDEPDLQAAVSEPTVIGFSRPEAPVMTAVEVDNAEPDFLADVPTSTLNALLPTLDNAEPDFLSELPATSNGAVSAWTSVHHDNAEPDFLTAISEPTVAAFKRPQAPTNGSLSEPTSVALKRPEFDFSFEEPEPVVHAPEPILPFDEARVFDDETVIGDAIEPTVPEPSPLADWLDESVIANGNGKLSANGHAHEAHPVDPSFGSADER